MYDQKVIDALAELRKIGTGKNTGTYIGTRKIADLINTLDNAGVFHEIDDPDPKPLRAHSAGHLTGSVDETPAERESGYLDAHDRAAEARLARRAFGIKD